MKNLRKIAPSADVEVYYVIRQAAKGVITSDPKEIRIKEDEAWKKWKSEFSSHHVRRCVRALLLNTTLKEALDPLINLACLREGMVMTTIHKWVSYRADEVSPMSDTTGPG
jgi:Protein of unknown function (DUF3723)